MSSGYPSSLLHDVLGSATAGIISRVVTHPLDTAKARVQAPVTSTGGRPNVVFRGPMDAILRTYQREGFRALYGGFGAVIVGGTPGTILYLTGYAFFRDTITAEVLKWRGGDATILSSGDPDKPSLSHGEQFAIHFSSGMLAEAVACVIYVPVDVVKERMQVQQKGKCDPRNYQYNGSWDALRRIMKTEGVSGVYRGYGATLASYGPFSALYFMFYEQFKSRSREYIQHQMQENESQNNGALKRVEDDDIPLTHLVACSAGAGALASWLTSPLDMAKLRLQVQRGQNATASKTGDMRSQQTRQYQGMLHCLRAAYKEAGIPGLFRGAGARVIHFAPATSITMTCYEKCRSFYADALS